MTKNPLLNAFAAVAYIALVASFFFYGTKFLGAAGHADSVIAPIAMLSLFVLSAAVMSTIFFYQPILLYLDGEKKTAVNLFFKTLLIFACITALIFSALFFRALY